MTVRESSSPASSEPPEHHFRPFKIKPVWDPEARPKCGCLSRGVCLLMLFCLIGLAAFLIHTGNMVYEDAKMRRSPHTQLQKLALAEQDCLDKTGHLATDWATLVEYGFEPDNEVRLFMAVVDVDWGHGRILYYQAIANYIKGPLVYGYSNLGGYGINSLDKAERLEGDQYRVTAEKSRRDDFVTVSGPPFLVFAVKIPGREN